MLEVVRTTQRVQVDETDLITLEEASALSKRALPVIANMLDRGKLPWYQMLPIGQREPKRIQRYTSRSAVLSLPAEKRTRPSPTTRKPRSKQ